MATKKDEVFEFLNEHTIATLSTASKKAEPWGAVVYYVVDEALNFYFLSHTDSKKYHNLEENPRAALAIADNKDQITVQAAGKVTELPGESEELAEAFRKLASIHPPGELRWTPPVAKIGDGRLVVFRLAPDDLQFAKFITNRPASRADIQKII